jgi:drug/metabolite transporter (DMT)-like permease
MSPREERSPATYAAFGGMCLIWGSTFLAIRIGNESLPPAWAAVLRLTIASFLYALIARLVGADWPRGVALRRTLVYGLLNYGIGFALVYWGEVRVASGTTATIYATTPLTTTVAAALIGLQRLRVSSLVGALIGLAGVASIFAGELRAGGPPAALVAIFCAATCGALSGVALKTAPPQSTWTVNGIGAAVGAPICLLASFAMRESHALPATLAGWGPVVYLVLAGNLGAYALYGWLLTKWRVTSVNAVALVIPVIAVLLGALVRSEAPPAGTYAGAALVIVGVGISLFTRHAEEH